MTRLSNSAKDKFLQCPRKWYIHYIQRLRGATLGSPLFFGGALDDAWGHLLLEKKVMPNDTEIATLKDKTAEQMFLDKMYLNNHNGEDKLLSLDLSVRYSNADVDLSLFTKRDYEAVRALDETLSNAEEVETFFEEYFSSKIQVEQFLKPFFENLLLSERLILVVSDSFEDLVY